MQPLARPISLKNDSIEIIRRLAPDWTFGPTAIDTHKGAVAHLRPPTESSRRNKEPACPRWIVTPQFAPGRPLQLSPTSKGSTFISLGENSLNYEILGETGFRTMVRLIDRCDCYRLEHASAGEAVRALEDLVRGLPAEGRHAAAPAGPELLLGVLVRPARMAELTEAQWDDVLPLARASHLGRLAAEAQAHGLADRPERRTAQFSAATALATHHERRCAGN